VIPVTFHPKAAAEVIEAVQYYESQSPGLGIALVTEIEATVRQIKPIQWGIRKSDAEYGEKLSGDFHTM